MLRFLLDTVDKDVHVTSKRELPRLSEFYAGDKCRTPALIAMVYTVTRFRTTTRGILDVVAAIGRMRRHLING
jgi:hypothetical protein